jgi:hypothetical protein
MSLSLGFFVILTKEESHYLLVFVALDGEFCTYMGIDFNEIEKLFKQ